MILCAEASCAASVRTAKAVVQEAGHSVSPALRNLANKSGHAETAFHATVADQGLALEVPLTELRVGGTGQSFPVLLLSDWIKLILYLGIKSFKTFKAFNFVWISWVVC